jgi:hypothetical protein
LIAVQEKTKQRKKARTTILKSSRIVKVVGVVHLNKNIVTL